MCACILDCPVFSHSILYIMTNVGDDKKTSQVPLLLTPASKLFFLPLHMHYTDMPIHTYIHMRAYIHIMYVLGTRPRVQGFREAWNQNTYISAPLRTYRVHMPITPRRNRYFGPWFFFSFFPFLFFSFLFFVFSSFSCIMYICTSYVRIL